MVLSRILTRQGLRLPDGRAIYEYAITDEEYAALHQALIARRERRAHAWGNPEAAEFCIYIAEWWQREFAGGSWTYADVLASVSLSEMENRQADVRYLIEKGLRHLGRALIALKNRQFLGTLATEGGLPTRLIVEQGTSLKAALLAIFEELRIYGVERTSAEELGARQLDRLPAVYQRAEGMAELLGNLACGVWRLAQRLAPEEDLSLQLERDHPGWRRKLPLRLADAQAQALLQDLLGTVVQDMVQHADLKATRRLRRRGDDWHLQTLVELPAYLSPATLSRLSGVPESDLRFTCTLRACSPDGDIIFASATKSQAGFRLESIGTSLLASGAQAEKALHLQVFVGKNEFGQAQELLAQPLDQVPWLFAPEDDAKMPLGLITTGSHRTRREEVLMAVLPGGRFEDTNDGVAERIAELSHGDRQVYRVMGSVVHIDAEGTRWRVRCAQPEDSAHTCWVKGERYDIRHARDLPVYRESSTAQIGTYIFEPVGLHFISSHTREESPWSRAAFGDGRMRIYDKDDDIVLQRRVCRLPDGARVRSVPTSRAGGGHLILTGFGGVEVGSSAENISLTVTERDQEVIVTPQVSDASTPATLSLHIRWRNGGGEARLRFPFPGAIARFVLGSQVLEHGAAWAAPCMNELRAEVTSPDHRVKNPVIVGRLSAADVCAPLADAVRFEVPLIEDPHDPLGRSYHLPLERIRPQVELALASSMHLDACVQLRLMWNGCSASEQGRLTLYRYEGSVIGDAAGVFRLQAAESFSAPEEAAEAGAVRLRAFRFQDVTDQVDAFVETTDNDWIIGASTFEPGSWCVLGLRGHYMSHRPAVFYVSGDSEPDEWSEICNIADRERRRARYRRIYQAMAEDPQHHGWSYVAGIFDAARELPATTFDALDCLVDVPRAVAMTLLRAGAERMEHWCDTLMELPFAWHLISVADWQAVIRLHRPLLADQLKRAGLPATPDQLNASLRAVVEYFAQQLGANSPVFVHLNETMGLGLGLPAQELDFARQKPEVLTSILDQHLDDLLRRKNADFTRWPDWQPSDSLLRNERFLRLRLRKDMSFRQPILDAPVLAALACAHGAHLERADVMHLRRLREFDRTWFDLCYQFTLVRILVSEEVMASALSD